MKKTGKQKPGGRSSAIFFILVIIILTIPLVILGIINYFYIYQYLINTVTQDLHSDLQYKITVLENQIERYNAVITDFKYKKMFYSYFIQEDNISFMDIRNTLLENMLKISADEILFYNSITNRVYSSDLAMDFDEYSSAYERYDSIDPADLKNIFLQDSEYAWIKSGILRMNRSTTEALLYIVPFETADKKTVSSFIFITNVSRLRNFYFYPLNDTQYEIYCNNKCIFSTAAIPVNYPSLADTKSFGKKNIYSVEAGNYGLQYIAYRPKTTIYSALDSLPLVLPVSLFCILGLEIIIAGVLLNFTKLDKKNASLSEENVLFKTITNSIIKEPVIDESNKQLISRIDDYIVKNYSDLNFSTKLMAAVFNMSVSNLSHFYKKFHEVTISGTVMLLRMETACNYLEKTEISVQEIVRNIGYQEVSSFIKKFKGKYGMTPGEYRERIRSD
ncbi:MAG: AraC family transcriptional regulator [Treponema sp.]|nr:AraC family transcriptional regulator [Treponema sp.]